MKPLFILAFSLFIAGDSMADRISGNKPNYREIYNKILPHRETFNQNLIQKVPTMYQVQKTVEKRRLSAHNRIDKTAHCRTTQIQQKNNG